MFNFFFALDIHIRIVRAADPDDDENNSNNVDDMFTKIEGYINLYQKVHSLVQRLECKKC